MEYHLVVGGPKVFAPKPRNGYVFKVSAMSGDADMYEDCSVFFPLDLSQADDHLTIHDSIRFFEAFSRADECDLCYNDGALVEFITKLGFTDKQCQRILDSFFPGDKTNDSQTYAIPCIESITYIDVFGAEFDVTIWSADKLTEINL